MMRGAIRLPWSVSTAPHGTLDIVRRCNISCEACYNAGADFVKSLDRIESDLDQLQSLRRVHTVTICGGEPTLHPQLVDVVRLIRSRDLRAALLTNGVLLDESLLADLKSAGLDLLFLHIQRGQRRPDLRGETDDRAVRDLLGALAEKVARAGIQAGVTVTLEWDRLQDWDDLIRDVMESPTIHFLLATVRTSMTGFDDLEGDLIDGIHGDGAPDLLSAGRSVLPAPAMEGKTWISRLGRLGLRPFGILGSSDDPDDPRWVSSLVACAARRDTRPATVALRPSLLERAAMRLHVLLTGRYVFYYTLGPWRIRFQLLANALLGGALLGNLRVLGASLLPGSTLVEKHLLFQRGPTVRSDGGVVVCRNCPDATVVNGRLVPVCLADRFASDPSHTHARRRIQSCRTSTPFSGV